MPTFMEDRSWMYNRHGRRGGVTERFIDGVKFFLDYAYSHPNFMSNDMIVCPCVLCKLSKWQDRQIVAEHLVRKGFVTDYYTWIYHGETNVDEMFGQADIAGPSNSNISDENRNQFNDMFADLGHGFFELNPHDNETSHASVVGVEVPNPQAMDFYNMLEVANEELYTGYSKISPLQAAAKCLQIKADTRSSINTHDAYLNFAKELLPSGNKLPSNFRQAELLLKKLGMGMIRIDACPNDCMLYYKETSNLLECPTCGMSRYVDEGTSSQKRKSAKILRYMPLAPRLQRLYMSRKTAPQMTWHYDTPPTSGVMTHPCHGQSWQMFDNAFPDFAAEPRNVRIALCTDGFSPVGCSARSYSIWAVMIVVYNLPPWLCMSRPYIFMPLLIPGRRSPGQNIDVYLRPLLDELKMLWSNGVMTWDAGKRQNFVMRVALMWTIGDFPAYGMLSGWSTHGKFACPICMDNTKSFTLRFGGKPCWFDCHRRHLSENHELRFESDKFRKDTVEIDPPPRRLDGLTVYNGVLLLPVNKFGPFMKSKERYPGFGETHNWRKISIFWELPYWPALPIRHVLDVMHTEKNFFDNLLYTSIGSKDKRNKDDIKARKDLQEVCSRKGLHLRKQGQRMFKPSASYTLPPARVRIFCEWLRNVRFPDGFASNISNCVNEEGTGIEGLKSHDCHVFMQRLLPIALRGFLPTNLWNTICELSRFFKDLTSPTLYTHRVNELDQDIPLILCKLEMVYPPGFFDSMEHITVHLPDEARLCGPTCFRWMYPFERFIGDLKHKCKNHALPEASICEEYLRHELSNFMSLYFDEDTRTVHNRRSGHDEGGLRGEEGCLSIFSHPGCPIRMRGANVNLFGEELNIAHTYILLNCPEVSPIVEQFDQYIITHHGRRALSHLSKFRDELFSDWLRNLAESVPPSVHDQRIIHISYGPSGFVRRYWGYKTNGFKFRTRDADVNKKTTHSGVCVKGAIYANDELDYYGIVEDILELTYGGNTVIVFKCHWFGTRPDTDIRVINGLVEVNVNSTHGSNDVFILASQAQQVYYIQYPPLSVARAHWVVASKVQPRRSFYATPAPVGHVDELFMDDDHVPRGGRVSMDEVPSLTNSRVNAEEIDRDEYARILRSNDEIDSSDYEVEDDRDHDFDE